MLRLLSSAAVLGALSIAVAACAGSPSRTPDATSTPAPTTVSEVASSTLVPPRPTRPSITAEPPCKDPYPGGAPFEPTPGTPVRLGPRGTPEALDRYDLELPDLDPTLLEVVLASLGDQQERFAIFIKNLDDGTGVALHPDRKFYAASLYKTWVMIEAFSQQDADLLDWDETYIVSDYYEAFGLNQGELAECDVVLLEEVLERMMAVTDNVAANVLLERVGAGNINRTLRGLGLSATGFVDEVRLPTTAREAALLLEAIYRGAVVTERASEAMLELLRTEAIDDRIPALLPADVEVAHKTGNWRDATHDAGIVFSPAGDYVIVVLSDYGYAEGGAVPIAELSLAVYNYYNDS